MYHLIQLFTMLLSRARLLAAACALLIWGAVTPALAALQTDFDDDGVINTVTLVTGVRPYIRIAAPGTHEPLVLPLKERVSSIVAIDVDHDGLTDLAATKRRGLIFWKNQGKGRFTLWHRTVRPRAPAHLTLTPLGPGVHPDDAAGRTEIEGAAGQDDHESAPLSARSVGQPTLTGSELFLARPSLPDDAATRSQGSRAPPPHTN
jgi:hypothetical protein